MIIQGITQPHYNSTLSAIEEVALRRDATHIDISVAYITSGGARDLIRHYQTVCRKIGRKSVKDGITSFDYCRTDPIALLAIKELPFVGSQIHDATRVLRQNCMPVRPYHPKVFIFRNQMSSCIIAGSGNASRSGLKLG